jgi:hypothetical protein
MVRARQMLETHFEPNNILMPRLFPPYPVLVRKVSTPTVVRMPVALLDELHPDFLELRRRAEALVRVIMVQQMLCMMAI